MSEPKILLDSTQTLRAYVEVDVGGEYVRGQPSAVTVRIATPSTSMPAEGAGVAADIDTLSTTLSGDVDEGAVELAIEEAAVVRGRRYLVRNPAGDEAVVKATKGGTLDTLYVAEPLPFEGVTGATVKGFSVSKALTAAQTEEAGAGLAMWRVTVDGVVYEFAQPFRIVRRLLVATLTADKLTTAWPVVRQLRTRNDLSLEEIIAAAWEHRVLPWLAAQDIEEEDVVSAHALEPLHAVGCVLQLAEGNTQIGPELVERTQRRWEQVATTTLARKDWHVEEQVEQPAPRPDAPAKPAMGMRLVR